MKRALSLFLLTAACGGTEPRQNADAPIVASAESPSASLIDALEERLKQSKCVGDLSRWDRQYNYVLGSHDLIQFVFVEARALGSAPERHIERPGATIRAAPDPAEMTAGTFNRKTGNLSIKVCREIALLPLA